MQGLFTERSKTMPAYMNAIWDAETTTPPGPRAFNFGVSAAHANDMYAMVTDITSRKAADVLVVHFNYPFFLQNGDVFALRYPQLWQGAASFAPFADDPLVTRYTAPPDKRTWPERGKQLLEQVWRLYGARDAFAAAWWESSAPEAWQKRYTEWERSREDSAGPPPARKLLPREFSRKQLDAIWTGPRVLGRPEEGPLRAQPRVHQAARRERGRHVRGPLQGRPARLRGGFGAPVPGGLPPHGYGHGEGARALHSGGRAAAAEDGGPLTCSSAA
jgi:hypothetical protein